jgi:L-asparaginase
MKNSKKKVLVLFCGGTISMHKNEETGALDVAHGADQLFKLEPRIVELAEIDVRFIDNLDSTNMTHVQWEKMISEIEKDYHNYDGFLITQGTNTLAYTSSALTWALQGIGKPVVITGAQIPAEIISTDGRNNLVNSLRVCTLDLGGVFVVFGSKIILGCRAKKVSESDLDAFKTFNQSDVGEIGVGLLIKDETRPGHKKPLKAKNGFEDNIVSITLVPGFKSDYLMQMIDDGAKGIVLRGYGSGDIPYDLLPVLEYAREKKVPVVGTTQCPGGATVLGVNDAGLQALKAGLIQAFDMSMETMTTKLMWLLKQKTSYEEIKKKMHENLAGEIDTRKARVILNKEML